jgi:hypothetical protein
MSESAYTPGPEPHEVERAFIEANRGRLQNLADTFEQLVDNQDHGVRIAIAPSDDEEVFHDFSLQFIRGKFTSEDYVELARNPEDAEEAARLRNNGLQMRCKHDVLTLLTDVSMERFAKAYWADSESVRQTLADDPDWIPQFQPFLSALYDELSFDSEDSSAQLELTRTKLYMADGAVYADYTARQDADGVSRCTKVITEDGRVSSVFSTTQADTNEVILRHYDVFVNIPPPQILVGDYESEEELDALLHSLWLDCQGTSHEETAGPLINELRTYAISVKEGHELALSIGGMHTPTVAEIDELQAVLNNLA